MDVRWIMTIEMLKDDGKLEIFETILEKNQTKLGRDLTKREGERLSQLVLETSINKLMSMLKQDSN